LTINTVTTGKIQRFSYQNNRIAHCFAHVQLGCQKRQRAVQSLKICGKSSSLHSKKIFFEGLRSFWVTS